MNKFLPASLTSYDFLKFVALVTMIIDHAGYFFFPEEEWMRMIGRISAPIWLFLVGYAQSRDFSLRMWIGIALIALSAFVVGDHILPLSILASILVFRALIDPVMAAIKANPAMLYPFMTILFFLMFPTSGLIEYGAPAMMFVILGYAVRHQDADPFLKSHLLPIALITAAVHAVFQGYLFFTFSFTPVQKLIVAAELLAIVVLLTQFRPHVYPALTARLPAPLVGLVQLAGRRSLEIYVAHIVLFRLAALALGLDGFRLFHLNI